MTTSAVVAGARDAKACSRPRRATTLLTIFCGIPLGCCIGGNILERFRVQGSRFKVQGSGFKVQGRGSKVQSGCNGLYDFVTGRREDGARGDRPRCGKHVRRAEWPATELATGCRALERGAVPGAPAVREPVDDRPGRRCPRPGAFAQRLAAPADPAGPPRAAHRPFAGARGDAEVHRPGLGPAGDERHCPRRRPALRRAAPRRRRAGARRWTRAWRPARS